MLSDYDSARFTMIILISIIVILLIFLAVFLWRVKGKKKPQYVYTGSDFQPQIDQALEFIDSLRFDDSSYWEVAEKDDKEHQVYKQSQYLLSIMFKLIGNEPRAAAIRSKHSPYDEDNDKNREGRKAGDGFCVLEEDEDNLNLFYLADCEEALNNDEKALLAMYWLRKKYSYKSKFEKLLDDLLALIGKEKISEKYVKKYRKKARLLYAKLLEIYDSHEGVLEMDVADSKKKLYSVFKVALFGILAKKMGDTKTLSSVRHTLSDWQKQSNKNGGLVTDLTLEFKLIGLANIETTSLSIITLIP